MSANPGQEQRAFLAVLLAMGVMLVWSLLFPPAPSPERLRSQEAPSMAGEPAGLQDATGAGPAPVTTRTAPESTSLPGSGPRLREARSGTGERRQVRIDGPALSLTLDGLGARLTEAKLHEYQERPGEPVQLIPPGGLGALGSRLVISGDLQSLDGFVFDLVSDNQSTEGRRIVWELDLTIGAVNPEQVTLRKTFVIPAEGNLFHVEHELVGQARELNSWGLSWAGGMRITEEQKGSQRGAYFHGSVLAEGKVQRKDPNNVRREPIEFPGLTYFLAIHNKYFLGAIVPKYDNQGPAKLWLASPQGTGEEQFSSLAGEIMVERVAGLATNNIGYDVFVGPQDYAALKELGIGLEATVDLGMSWIRPLSRTMLGFLIWMHGLIPNYGFVIVLFSSLINLLFFPLTYKSTKSMRDMSALKPRLDALKAKYKDEPQKMSEATMRLYKEAGVNPLAGCFPILLQMPIFFALYAVLFRTIELRQEPFIFWIKDLSQPDVIFHLPFGLPFIGSGIALLPIIMGVTSYFQSKQTMVDPSQKMMVTLMPVMMTFIFFTMPSGLVLYWLTSNLFTISQKFLMKPSSGAAALLEPPPDEAKPTRSARRPRKKRTAKAASKS